MTSKRKQVAILLYEGCWAMGVFSAKDFFHIVQLLTQHMQLPKAYDCYLVSYSGAAVTSASGTLIQADTSIEQLTTVDVLIIPPAQGQLLKSPIPHEAFLSTWIAKQVNERKSIVSFTTGAYLLASGGSNAITSLATHWAFLPRLQRQFPHVTFTSDKDVMEHQNVFSTSTFSGGFEALLRVIAQHISDEFAQLCASHLLIVDPSTFPVLLHQFQRHDDAQIAKVQQWLQQHFAEAIKLPELAKQFGFSERNLKRRFQLATGISTIAYLQQVRVEKAKQLLLCSTKSIKQIAYEVGYDNDGFLIRLFKKQFGVTPSAWRQSVAETVES